MNVAFVQPGQKALVKLTAYDFSINGGPRRLSPRMYRPDKPMRKPRDPGDLFQVLSRPEISPPTKPLGKGGGEKSSMHPSGMNCVRGNSDGEKSVPRLSHQNRSAKRVNGSTDRSGSRSLKKAL